jgi:hypothetical protein
MLKSLIAAIEFLNPWFPIVCGCWFLYKIFTFPDRLPHINHNQKQQEHFNKATTDHLLRLEGEINRLKDSLCGLIELSFKLSKAKHLTDSSEFGLKHQGLEEYMGSTRRFKVYFEDVFITTYHADGDVEGHYPVHCLFFKDDSYLTEGVILLVGEEHSTGLGHKLFRPHHMQAKSTLILSWHGSELYLEDWIEGTKK